MNSRRQTGFTLVELMVACAIVAILAAIAYPSYTAYIVRSNRAAAQAQMVDIANREQQFLLSNRAYVTESSPEWISSTFALPPEVSRHYTYAITVATTVPAFTVTFTPTLTGRQVKDGPLTFNSQGVKTPASKW